VATAQKRAAESWRYVLKSDESLPPEQQSVFVLTPLNVIERAEARDGMVRRVVGATGETTVSQRDKRLSVEFCLSHIREIENFPAGAPKPWPDTSDERLRYLDQLDDSAVQELGNEIWVRSELGETEKNS
jgi:hypothetical protein